MAMGMGSNKKRSNAGLVAWCAVLGLALLFPEAAGRDTSYCQNLCRGRPYLQYIHCLDVCMLTPSHGAAARLAGHGRTAGEEAGGRAGILAMPAERAGREEEEKGKQEEAGHLAEPHGDAAYCSAFCNGWSDFGQCYNECLYGRVTGQEEASGGGGVAGRAGRLAMPTERAGREGEEKGDEAEAVLHVGDPVWCYDACRQQKVLPQDQCVRECYAENMPDAARPAAHGGKQARGGAADGVTAVGKPNCDWFRDCSVTPCVWHCGKRAQEEAALHKCEWFLDCSVTPCVWRRCGRRTRP